MKALIRLDIPDYQIGQEVFCYFNDSMTIRGICEEDNTEDSQCDSCDYDFSGGECYDCVKGNNERYVTAEEYSTWDKFTLNEDEQEPCEDCISREATIKALFQYAEGKKTIGQCIDELPSVTPQQKIGHCRDCKWWKDSDGAYRRGIGAESKCPLNHIEVLEGNGYCFLFEQKKSEEEICQI